MKFKVRNTVLFEHVGFFRVLAYVYHWSPAISKNTKQQERPTYFGMVRDITPTSYVVASGGIDYYFPHENSPDWSDDFPTLQGYLRPAKTKVMVASEPIKPVEKRCTCGAHATYGPTCNSHSDWCDIA